MAVSAGVMVLNLFIDYPAFLFVGLVPGLDRPQQDHVIRLEEGLEKSHQVFRDSAAPLERCSRWRTQVASVSAQLDRSR